jgi:serine/threonine protein kinase/CHASE2 domain-containing sensor protein
MRARRSARRILALLTVALLAGGAGVAARCTGVLGSLGRDSVDARFSVRASHGPPRNVVVVGIDNDSLGDLPRYPFSRRLHARVLEALHAAGARLIVYDVSFDRPTTRGADDVLFEAARRASPVIFATSLISPSGRTQVLGGDSNLASIGDRAAAANLLPDGDGTLRHVLGHVNGLPTLALAVGEQLGVRAKGQPMPRGAWIDFPGPPGTIHEIPFLSVLRGTFNRASVRGSIVVVGATASLLQDLHDTAGGSPMSGPEVQAAAISTVLRGFPLRSGSALVAFLLIALLALVVPIIGLRLGTLGVVLVGVIVALAWSLVTQLAFDSGLMLDYVDPLLALLLATAGTMLFGLWGDNRERMRLRMLFAASSTSVVEETLNHTSNGLLEPTAIVAGYEIERVVGRGGMGVVYRASQLALGRAVAIKLIAPGRSEDPLFRERFKTESRIAASIEHANVIPVYEAGEDNGLLFIAMRLVDGLDLAQLLDREDFLQPGRAVRTIGQLAGALDAAHARGLVHRDIKPANALITFDEPEHVYLTDFGVAKQLGAGPGVTQVDQWVGTLDYLAPEQIRGEHVGPSADIYALTGVLYHCLTGEVPFPRDTEVAKLWAHINAAPPRASQLRSDLPAALDGVIERGMSKTPRARFATAWHLIQACEEALGIVANSHSKAIDRSGADPPTQSPAQTSISERPASEKISP